MQTSLSDSSYFPPDLHVLVPWATCLLPECEVAFPKLDQLPYVAQVLQQLTQTAWLRSDEYAAHAPHEVLWAKALGWPEGEPIAKGAYLAREAGLIDGHNTESAWGLMTLCHWSMGHDSLTVLPIDEQHLSDSDSRTLFESVRPLFESEGWHIYWVSAQQWLVCHPSLADMPSVSLDRVLGRNPDVWLPIQTQTRLVRRLQAEVQMLWYGHRLNNQREQQGLNAVNSFWLSGCGTLPKAMRVAPELLMVDGPRQALLRMDTVAWQLAWKSIDSDIMPLCLSAIEQGKSVQLSLCGERHAVTCYALKSSVWWRRALSKWQRRSFTLSNLLKDL